MSDDVNDVAASAAQLEQQLEVANRRLIQAELRNQAIRAGIIDLDGLQMADTSGLKIDADGNVTQAQEVLVNLKKAKPWLFANASSSQLKPAPASEPPKVRNAKTMTESEWKAARARLIRGR
jgi:hypothetical protein